MAATQRFYRGRIATSHRSTHWHPEARVASEAGSKNVARRTRMWPYLVCAALTGFGGGNFASSMTNINAFYPQRLKGWALGLNAGGGNLGVPVIQLVGLLVIATAGNRASYWVCAVYLVLLAVAGVGAALFMHNLDHHRIDLTAMRSILSVRDTWVVALLYIGSFGSFIGFSFAFGQVLQINFT